MASTEMLARIAAKQLKPDGCCVINDNDMPQALAHLPLQTIPGVSDGVERRLNAASVYAFDGLWKLDRQRCRAIWSNIEGERF